jgi:hypothetical protein
MSYQHRKLLDEGVHPWKGFRPFRRHSLVLLVAGLAYVFIGVSYIFTELTPARAQSLVVALHWAPIQFWGSTWILVGALSIISSKWPPVVESWGYMVLTGFSAGWSATYLTGVILGESPAGNINSVIIWALMAFMWWAISGLINPDRVAIMVVEKGELDEHD